MSVCDLDSVDMIASRPDSNVVYLIIADHLDWSDASEHERLLARKTDFYITFLSLDELEAHVDPAVPRPRDVRVRLAAKYPVPDAEAAFIAGLKQKLASRGILLEVVLKPDVAS